MSKPLAKPASIMTWVVAVLLTLLLYVGTWPIVELTVPRPTFTVLPNGTLHFDTHFDPEPYLAAVS